MKFWKVCHLVVVFNAAVVVQENRNNRVTSKSVDISFDIVAEQEVNEEVTK